MGVEDFDWDRGDGEVLRIVHLASLVIGVIVGTLTKATWNYIIQVLYGRSWLSPQKVSSGAIDDGQIVVVGDEEQGERDEAGW